MNRVFPVLMLVLGFVAGTSVAVAYANGGIDMFADVFIDGTLTVQDGTEGVGKVFTSDGAGTGSWQTHDFTPFDPSGLQTQIDSNDSDILQIQTDVSDVDGRVTIIENTPTSNHLYVIQFGNDVAIGTVQHTLEHRFDRQMITKGGTLTEVQYGHDIGIGIHIGNQVLAKVYLNDVQIGSCTTTITEDPQICDLNITPINVSGGDILEITDFGIVNNSLNSALDVREKWGSATITLD